MRILIIVGQFPAISEVFMLDLVASLQQMGHEVWIEGEEPSASARTYYAEVVKTCAPYTLYRGAFPNTLPSRLADGVARIVRWGWRSPSTLMDCLNPMKYGRAAATGRILCQVIPRGKRLGSFDVIHAHFGPNGVRAIGARSVGALDGPLVTTFHGFDVNTYLGKEGQKLYTNLFCSGELFTVASEFMRQRLTALGAPAARIRRVPVPIRLTDLSYHERSSPSDGVFKILSVGRLVEVKGFEYGIRAISVLHQKGCNIRYTIVGDGPLRNDLENLAHDLGVGDVVTFAGARHRSDVSSFYDDSHILLCPGVISKSGEVEAFGCTLIEGQACGMPVIASNLGGMPEVMVDGQSGILVRERNVEALAAAIESLLDRHWMWPQIGRAGRQHVVERFDNSKGLKDLLDVYAEAQLVH